MLAFVSSKTNVADFQKKTPFLSFSKEKHGFYELCRLVLVHLHYILIKIKKQVSNDYTCTVQTKSNNSFVFLYKNNSKMTLNKSLIWNTCGN